MRLGIGTTNRLSLELCSEFRTVLDLAAPRYAVKALLNRIRDELDHMIDSDFTRNETLETS